MVSYGGHLAMANRGGIMSVLHQMCWPEFIYNFLHKCFIRFYGIKL